MLFRGRSARPGSGQGKQIVLLALLLSAGVVGSRRPTGATSNIALMEVPGQGLPVVHSGVSLAALAPLRGAGAAAFRIV
jgi:hypothetical protein